ncbi:MAG TPA: alginate O-acetyltransferase AlgF [Gammaproteobacteria bacterium]|nr:alginate O-acetyltransferase AlgF [Gammaproteobacteria bacterium]
MKNIAWMLMFAIYTPFLIPPAAAVEEAALYAEDAPEGSAFVRVFNAYSAQTLENIDLGGKVIKTLDPLESSPYVFLPAGGHAVRVEGKNQQVTMREGEFYTVIAGSQFPLTVIRDEAFNNRRKALVSLYNVVSKEKLDLKTADGGIPIIEDVGFLGNKTREINPVRLSVEALAGDTPLGQSKPVNLQWGKVFSLFACGESGQPSLVWVENKIDTTL